MIACAGLVLGFACGHDVCIHRHDDFAGRHDEPRKRTFRFSRESCHHIVGKQVRQGRAFDLYAYELLYRREPDGARTKRNLGPRYAAVDK